VCRNIRVLHNFEPPSTRDEIRAAALQYVRKVSGLNKPSTATEAAFQQAVEQVAVTTQRLLAALPPRLPQRTREAERERARRRGLRFRDSRVSGHSRAKENPPAR
jgi:hypothetical protein